MGRALKTFFLLTAALNLLPIDVSAILDSFLLFALSQCEGQTEIFPRATQGGRLSLLLQSSKFSQFVPRYQGTLIRYNSKRKISSGTDEISVDMLIRRRKWQQIGHTFLVTPSSRIHYPKMRNIWHRTVEEYKQSTMTCMCDRRALPHLEINGIHISMKHYQYDGLSHRFLICVGAKTC